MINTTKLHCLTAPVSFAALAAFLLPLAGCKAGGYSASGGGGYGSPAQAPADNILRAPLMAEPGTFDPALAQSIENSELLSEIYDGLLQITTKNTLGPDLAQSFTKSKDGLVYTFHLRSDVKFQSGAPLTAQDVVFSLTRSLSPKIASPVGLTYLGNIAGAQDYSSGKASSVSGLKAIDPLTVQVTLARPYAYWLNVLTYPCAYVVNPVAVQANPDGKITDANTDGTGPFSLTSYSRGQSVDLKANPNYFDGAPKIAGQHRPILPNANTRHEEFVAGNLDLCEESSGSVDTDKRDSRLKDDLTIYPRAETWYIAFGERTQPVFKDARVRQAFAYATNKAPVVQTVFFGRRSVAQDILPKGMPGWDAGFQGLPYDPGKAKALLAAAGYPGGRGFPAVELDASETYPDAQKAANLLAEQYASILGVKVQPRSIEGNTIIANEVNGSMAMWHQAWIADYLDPQDYYSLLYRTGAQGNHTGYSNPAFDKIVDAADVEQDPAKRAALYRQAAKVLAVDVPMIPMYYGDRAELKQPWVQGIDDCLINRLPYKHLYFSR